MAIALDTSAAAHSGGDPSPYNVSYTCTGTNLALVVFVNMAVDALTGVTYNSVALTPIDKITVAGTITLYSYLLLGPATGLNTLAFTYTGTPQVFYVAISVTGASQTGAPGTPDAHGTNSSASETSTAVPLTTIADNCWIFVGARDTNDSALAASTNDTEAANDANYFGGFYTPTAQTPAGAKTCTITHTGSLKSVELSLAPVAAGGTGARHIDNLAVVGVV